MAAPLTHPGLPSEAFASDRRGMGDLPDAPLHDLETVTVVTACEGVSPCPAVDVNHLLKIGSDHSRWLYRDADRVGES